MIYSFHPGSTEGGAANTVFRKARQKSSACFFISRAQALPARR